VFAKTKTPISEHFSSSLLSPSGLCSPILVAGRWPSTGENTQPRHDVVSIRRQEMISCRRGNGIGASCNGVWRMAYRYGVPVWRTGMAYRYGHQSSYLHLVFLSSGGKVRVSSNVFFEFEFRSLGGELVTRVFLSLELSFVKESRSPSLPVVRGTD
jgi:hypothetical protein